jgi:nicotinate-nucleotide adenylyltransferase
VPPARRRIGLLGGTFDPPHIGHLALARSARDALALQEVRFLPTGQSWQKPSGRTPAAHRMAMVTCALEGLDPAEGLRVDDREVRRSGPSYTVDTLGELRAELGEHPALVLIIGSDQLHNLASWHRWQDLFRFAHVAVTQRERVPLTGLPEPVQQALEARGCEALPDAPAGSIVFFRMPAVPVSATVLRDHLARGEAVSGLTPPAVLDYIAAHSLYAAQPPSFP